MVSVLPDWIEETAPPPEIDRRDITSPEEVVPEVAYVVSDPQTYINRTIAGQNVTWVGQGAPPQIMGPVVAPSIVTPTEEPVSWIEDIYDWTDENVFGGNLPGGVPVGGQVIYNSPVGGSIAPPVVIPGGGGGNLPPAVIAPAACGPNDPMQGMVYSKRCGVWGWHKRKGRRRKRLATASDIKDLSALQGVFGNGKALQAWIATHS